GPAPPGLSFFLTAVLRAKSSSTRFRRSSSSGSRRSWRRPTRGTSSPTPTTRSGLSRRRPRARNSGGCSSWHAMSKCQGILPDSYRHRHNCWRMTSRRLRRILNELGCVEVRQVGSHLRVECEKCRTTVPVHAGEDLKPGTLRAIERDLEPCLGKQWLRRR